jgi:hypothetical protein
MQSVRHADDDRVDPGVEHVTIVSVVLSPELLGKPAAHRVVDLCDRSDRCVRVAPNRIGVSLPSDAGADDSNSYGNLHAAHSFSSDVSRRLVEMLGPISISRSRLCVRGDADLVRSYYISSTIGRQSR